MGVLATLTYLSGNQFTEFLTDSQLASVLAAGDINVKMVYPDIPDYLINTLNLGFATDLNRPITAQELTSLLLQGGIVDASDPQALSEAAQGQFTVQSFINTFLNETGSNNTQPPTLTPSYQLQITKAAFTPDGKTVQLAITATPDGTIPEGAKSVQFNIQIVDKKSGKITNNDSFATAIDGYPAYATFDENVPIGTNDVTINVYLLEPNLGVELASPLLGYEVNGNPNVLTNNSKLVRDAIIGAALFVGVPVGVAIAWKHHNKKKGQKK
ncbi:MAG: hypothetical protein KGI11_09480 [Thaumarchaeota archaeon]|nr:hypothetical protein [Nitrososphaerota archaeon]